MCKKALLIGSVIASLMVGTAKAEPDTSKIYGDWMLTIENQSGVKTAQIVQTVASAKDPGHQVLKLAISYTKDHQIPEITAIVPLGLFLTQGLPIRIDQSNEITLPWQYCFASGCVARRLLTQEHIESLIHAKQLNVNVLPVSQQKTVTIPLSPKGLQAALAALRT